MIGIVDEALRDRGFLGAAIITSTAASDYFGVDRPERVVVEVEIGAGELIAVQGPIALAPSAPENLAAAAPVLPQAARDRVAGDVDSLFLLLAIVSLVVGAIGIANVTLVTVMERTGEIGLRRAVGARRRHIATQFLGESAVIGLVGGVIGASIGLIVVVSVSAAKGWTPVLDPWMPLVAPLSAPSSASSPVSTRRSGPLDSSPSRRSAAPDELASAGELDDLRRCALLGAVGDLSTCVDQRRHELVGFGDAAMMSTRQDPQCRRRDRLGECDLVSRRHHLVCRRGHDSRRH